MENTVEIAPMYRTIFVVEPTRHDLTPLRKYADNIKYLSSGYDKLEDLKVRMSEELLNFDPAQDAVIPTGKLLSNVILGVLLSKFSVIDVGIFIGGDVKDYIFEEVQLDGSR